MKIFEIIICTNCDGKGILTRRVMTNYHKGEYDLHHFECYKCSGSGRLNLTITKTLEPFIPTPEKIGTIT